MTRLCLSVRLDGLTDALTFLADITAISQLVEHTIQYVGLSRFDLTIVSERPTCKQRGGIITAHLQPCEELRL